MVDLCVEAVDSKEAVFKAFWDAVVGGKFVFHDFWAVAATVIYFKVCNVAQGKLQKSWQLVPTNASK